MTESIRPLVSVVVPVYNTKPDDLRSCFASLSQAKDARLEIIAVDDGSRAETAHLLDDIAAECSNTVHVIHKTNGGQSSARNRGIAEARGEYIEFVDSDDYVDWDAQQRVLETLTSHKPDILQINVVGMTEAGVYFWPPKHGDGEYREIDKLDRCIVEQVCRGARRIVVIHSVCDTTNIGAIFRSAAALGIDAVLLTRDSCDPLNRRAVRVSMGSVFLVPWTWLESLDELHALGFKTAAMALTEQSLPLDDPRLKEEQRLALIMGTEGDGLPHSTIAAADYTVRIPMMHGVDSLNVAAAVAVACWELRV